MHHKKLFEQFEYRHIGPRESDIEQMLSDINCKSIEELISKTIPEKIRLTEELKLTEPLSEFEFLSEINSISKKNKLYKSYIGLGYNPTILPSVIRRNILENPGWYTQYTPYQAEISQ